MKGKMVFRTIGKFGLLLAVFGFFMPIQCGYNGFQIAEFMMHNDAATDGLLMYLLLISAFIGVIIGFLLLAGKNVNAVIDWVTTVVCTISAIILYSRNSDNTGGFGELQSGAYTILIGLTVAFIGQIISSVMPSETSTETPI